MQAHSYKDSAAKTKAKILRSCAFPPFAEKCNLFPRPRSRFPEILDILQYQPSCRRLSLCGNKAQHPCKTRHPRAIGGVIDAVFHLDLGKIKRAYPCKAGDIYAKLVRVRAALMMGVNAAKAAKVVLRGLRVELIERQLVLALHKADILQPRRDRNRAAHPAIGTGAAPNAVKAITQPDLKLHRPTMTSGLMQIAHGKALSKLKTLVRSKHGSAGFQAHFIVAPLAADNPCDLHIFA